MGMERKGTPVPGMSKERRQGSPEACSAASDASRKAARRNMRFKNVL